ncbi:MAG TPA: MarR family transcriptional regulator [Caldilineae bacterium]|nr:MarR family transcriptional regulator [Caldilineae bacterium]
MPTTNQKHPGPGQIDDADMRNKLMRLNWLQHRRFAQEIADLKLTVPQFFTLSTLESFGGKASMGELARSTYQVSATMTGIIDRLVRDGLVERRRAETDRRSVVVVITPAGQKLVDQAWSRALGSLDTVLNEMNSQEMASSYRFVDALVNTLEN